MLRSMVRAVPQVWLNNRISLNQGRASAPDNDPRCGQLSGWPRLRKLMENQQFFLIPSATLTTSKYGAGGHGALSTPRINTKPQSLQHIAQARYYALRTISRRLNRANPSFVHHDQPPCCRHLPRRSLSDPVHHYYRACRVGRLLSLA